MESSLTTPLQVINMTAAPHLYTDSFQTLFGQFLSSDIRLQLLILQILQLIQDYQNLMPSTPEVNPYEEKSENYFAGNLDMSKTQLVRPNALLEEKYYPTNKETEARAEKMQGINFRILREKGWTPNANLIDDKIDSSNENLEKRKHDIVQTQFLESDNNIYFKLEALMEKQKILINEMRLNMINLQQHETQLEEEYGRKTGQVAQLIHTVRKQRGVINNLKEQLQTCKTTSSSRLLELKNKTREIKRLKFRLNNKSMVEKQLPNCTNASLECVLELRNKDEELQELNSKLEDTETQLEVVTSNLMFNLSKFSNNVSEIQPIRSLLDRINNLETRLEHCSISSSAILLKLKNKSDEIEELTSKLQDNDAFEVKLKNCSAYSSNLSTQLNDLKGQISKLLDGKKQLQTCSNNYSCLLNFQNKTSAIHYLISVMRDNDNLKTKLQNCSIQKEEQLSKLINTSNELVASTSYLSNKERQLETCQNSSILLLSELSNKTSKLEEKSSKLQDMETKLENCSGDASSILLTLDNKTAEITFLISVLKERDLLRAQLRNCSAERMQQLSESRNQANEIIELRARIRNQDMLGTDVQNCSNYLSMLNSEENNKTTSFQEVMYKLLDTQTKLQTCSHNLSSALLNLDNLTNEIQRLTSMLNTQDNLEAQVQNCYHTLYTTIYNDTSDLTTKLRDRQSCELQLQNCTNISLALQVELENKTTEIQNIKLENKNYEIQLLNCYKVSYPASQELTSAQFNMSMLEDQLENCTENSSALLKELNNKTSIIQALTLKLQNGDDLEDKFNQCTALSSNLSMELVNKTNDILELTSELIAQGTNEYNCSNILSPLLKELRTKTIQVQNLTAELDNNTLIKNLQWELRKAEQKLEAEQNDLLQFLTFLQNHSSDVCDLQSLPKAAAYGEPLLVQAWLDTGVNPDTVDNQGYTALQRAAIAGNLQLVMLLVQHGANLTALSTNQFGDLPIHLAVAYGHQNIVQWMLDNGVPVDVRNRMGATPLHSAAHNSRLEIARFLLDRGAAVNANVINSDNRTPLHEAAAVGSVDLVQLLLDRGADINAVTSDENQTPLHWAEKVGQLRTAELLIQRGADITARDKNGKTPLELAPSYINDMPYPWH